jgi:hypothetical protein
MYIDTSYEGDLMAAAGVTFTVGREGTNVYGESLAGIRPLGGSYNYDPYVVPGNPASGLLPFVQAPSGGNVGDGDHRLQAYNFRLCLTQNATNKIPIAPPPGYSEARYELFRRYINARIAQDGSVALGNLIHIQSPHSQRKDGHQRDGELSTDYVGYNYSWATNTHAGRALLRQEHEDYIRGLLYFLATSTNLPASLRSEAQSWGLAKDEFRDTGGWPWQIYVREARRMVSDYVMIQHNAEGRRVAPDPIALARYNIDSHGVQRLPSGSSTRWEGSIGSTPPYPYGISYRSIIPRAGECQNLFVTFALSASHVGFASVRMEPVFMMTSQSAATAAAFAQDDEVPAQQVDYAKLAAQLRADGQLLTWDSPAASTNGIILDQGGPDNLGWHLELWRQRRGLERGLCSTIRPPVKAAQVGSVHAEPAYQRNIRGLSLDGSRLRTGPRMHRWTSPRRRHQPLPGQPAPPQRGLVQKAGHQFQRRHQRLWYHPQRQHHRQLCRCRRCPFQPVGDIALPPHPP